MNKKLFALSCALLIAGSALQAGDALSQFLATHESYMALKPSEVYLISSDEIEGQAEDIRAEMASHDKTRKAVLITAGAAATIGAYAWLTRGKTDAKSYEALDKKFNELKVEVAGLKSAVAPLTQPAVPAAGNQKLFAKLFAASKKLGVNIASQAYSTIPVLAGFSIAGGVVAEVARLTSAQRVARSIIRRTAQVVMPYNAALVVEKADLVQNITQLVQLAAYQTTPEQKAVLATHVQHCRTQIARLLGYMQVSSQMKSAQEAARIQMFMPVINQAFAMVATMVDMVLAQPENAQQLAAQLEMSANELLVGVKFIAEIA